MQDKDQSADFVDKNGGQTDRPLIVEEKDGDRDQGSDGGDTVRGTMKTANLPISLDQISNNGVKKAMKKKVQKVLASEKLRKSKKKD